MRFCVEWRAATWKCCITPSQTSISCTCTRAVYSHLSLPTVASGSSARAKTISLMRGGHHTEPASSRYVLWQWHYFNQIYVRLINDIDLIAISVCCVRSQRSRLQFCAVTYLRMTSTLSRVPVTRRPHCTRSSFKSGRLQPMLHYSSLTANLAYFNFLLQNDN